MVKNFKFLDLFRQLVNNKLNQIFSFRFYYNKSVPFLISQKGEVEPANELFRDKVSEYGGETKEMESKYVGEGEPQTEGYVNGRKQMENKYVGAEEPQTEGYVNGSLESDIIEDDAQQNSAEVQENSTEDWKDELKYKVELEESLGRGCFGEVWKGKTGSQHVAVKVLQSKTERGLAEMKMEVGLLG